MARTRIVPSIGANTLCTHESCSSRGLTTQWYSLSLVRGSPFIGQPLRLIVSFDSIRLYIASTCRCRHGVESNRTVGANALLTQTSCSFCGEANAVALTTHWMEPTHWSTISIALCLIGSHTVAYRLCLQVQYMAWTRISPSAQTRCLRTTSPACGEVR